MFIICASLFVTGCSRPQSIINTYQGNGIYFTTENGHLYEYSGSLAKVEDGRVNSVNKVTTQSLHTSTPSSLNIISTSGKIIFRHEPNHNIQASVINAALSSVIYVTKNGQLFHYDRAKNITTDLDLSLYPVPKQMVLDEQNNVIFYHDKSMVYKLDLSTLKVTVLTKVYLPIQSIAHNTKTGEIYLSTSTDGKIYKLNQYFSSIQLVHESISARGPAFQLTHLVIFCIFQKAMVVTCKLNH